MLHLVMLLIHIAYTQYILKEKKPRALSWETDE